MAGNTYESESAIWITHPHCCAIGSLYSDLILSSQSTNSLTVIKTSGISLVTTDDRPQNDRRRADFSFLMCKQYMHTVYGSCSRSHFYDPASRPFLNAGPRDVLPSLQRCTTTRLAGWEMSILPSWEESFCECREPPVPVAIAVEWSRSTLLRDSLYDFSWQIWRLGGYTSE